MLPSPALPDPNAGKVPTWGYSAAGGQLFHLDPGAGLPDGFVDHPDKVGATPEPKRKKKAVTDDDSADHRDGGVGGTELLRGGGDPSE